MSVFWCRFGAVALSGALASCGGPEGEASHDDATTSASSGDGQSSSSTASGIAETSDDDGPCFSAWQEFPAGPDFSPLFIDDVDGDGLADLVSAHEQQIRIHLGRDDDTGLAPPIEYMLESPCNGGRVLPTDPGQPPRVLLSSYTGTSSTFDIVHVADGTVTRTVQMLDARVIDSGDFDGDGTFDAIVLNRDLDVDVYLAAPDGSLTWTANMLLWWLAAIDVDGDGRTDLVDAVGSDLWFQRSLGDGTFDTKAQLGLGFDDRVVDATAIALDGEPALLVHLERADAGGRDAGFAVVARDSAGTWVELARTEWIGDSWLRDVTALPGVAPLAFFSYSFSDIGSNAFVLSASGDLRRIDVVSFEPFLAELDGASPPELLDASGWGMAALTSASEGWDTRVELEQIDYVEGVGDFDGDGLDDLLTQRADTVALWHNEGCLTPDGT